MSEMFWKKTSFETEHLSQSFKKQIKLNLLLANPELLIIY